MNHEGRALQSHLNSAYSISTSLGHLHEQGQSQWTWILQSQPFSLPNTSTCWHFCFVSLLLSRTTFIYQSKFKPQEPSERVQSSSFPFDQQFNMWIYSLPWPAFPPDEQLSLTWNSFEMVALSFPPQSNLSRALMWLGTQLWTQYLTYDIIKSSKWKMTLLWHPSTNVNCNYICLPYHKTTL